MTVSNQFGLASLAVAAASLALPVTASAQDEGRAAGALEEIVVTAQRREQSLLEVPVSIETFTGIEIQQQGYRDLNELANFSASVYIDDDGFLSQDRSIRGFGTSGNALTLEQAVPIFVDGIHFGRPAQVRLAFMDPARVEVLKGPQPVYFGMNAIAGAFNITSAGPTPEWEGYLDAEYASHSTSVFNGAVGGPLSDTVGIRVAGKYENAGGYIKDLVTERDIGAYENYGGRVILEVNPRENLEITAKVEYAELERDPEATVLCLTDGPLRFNRNQDGTEAPPGQQGNERSIWAPPPQGVGWDQNYQPLKTNCESDIGDSGISNGGPFFAPPDNIREENSNFGAIDARAAVDELIRIIGVSDGLDDSGERLETTNAYLNIDYEFGNEIMLTWLTGYSAMDRANSRDNSNSPFLVNYQNRGEDYTQTSSELRFTSGPGKFEWMAGYTWQDSDLDFINNSPRPNVRRGWRYNDGYEKTTWNTAFATVTFNFMNDKMSLDLGGRWTDIDKVGAIAGRTGVWVYDVQPCDPDVVVDELNPPPADPSTCALHEDAQQITATDALFLLPGADTSNLWVIPYRDSRNTPLSWINSRAAAIGLMEVPYEDAEGDGPYGPGMGGDFDISEFDPQVTLRWRPNPNHNLFLRYAESFKAGGFDTGVTSINEACTNPLICETPYDNFSFDPEFADTIELGSKGTFGDGRFRYNVTAFETTFEDLQITISTGIVDDPFLNVNAGEQRVRGLEFGLTGAITENLTLDFAGAFLDGEYVEFGLGGCTEDELRNAATGPCISAEESIELVGDDSLEGRIDRTGQATPKTPEWKFVFGLDYDVPLANDYRLNLNAKGYASDGFLTDVNGFSRIVMMDQHEDLTLTLSYGPQDGEWLVSAFGRNLLEAKPSYHSEPDIFDDGLVQVQLSRSHLRSFGVKFRYNF